MPDLPKSVDLLQPLLRALKNGLVLTNDQIRNEVARELSLTSEQLNQIHSGSRTELEYRLAWARTNAKSRKLIEQLFTEGKSVKNFPLRMVFLQVPHTSTFPIQAAFSVPKRNFKRAVDRNRIKRLLRETYRLQKEIVYTKLDKPTICMISYIGRD